jgi:hypothetical protein
MQSSNDFSSDISIDEVLRKLKMFSKDIQSAVSSNETDKRDGSLRNVVKVRQCEFWGWKHWGIASFLDEL